MASNLHLDKNLVQQAMKWGKHATQRAAIRASLENYVQLMNDRRAEEPKARTHRRTNSKHQS
jgi:hypothetical protein